MSAFRRPIKISRKESKSRDITVQLLNLNILSHNQGPAFAMLLKVAVLAAFAYTISKFIKGEPLFKKTA